MPLPDAVATADAIRRRELSPVEAVEDALARIAGADPAVNAYTVVLAEEARAAARDAERVPAAGPLHGVPVCVKDVLWLAGAPATNGSRAFRDFVPAEDAVAVRRLREAGAIVVGKTNNPELCLAGFTDNEVYGLTRNPWDTGRTPGGSSGGTGAALACGTVPLGLGTDGGGSIRIPASFCGVAGIKPTFGLVPDAPTFRGWRTLSCAGPLARSVRDLALALDVLAGPDPADPTSALGAPVPPADPAGLRIAWSADLGFAPVEPDVRESFLAAVARLDGAGFRLEEAHPDTGGPAELWTRFALAEGSAGARDLLDRRDLLEERTAATIEAGLDVPATAYLDAYEERLVLARTWLEFFERYDLLLTPTMQMTAFATGLDMPPAIAGEPVDPRTEDWCQFLYQANLTGQPAASVPCGLDSDGLPIGLQIVGRRLEDATVLRFAAAWEELAPWPQTAA